MALLSYHLSDLSLIALETMRLLLVLTEYAILERISLYISFFETFASSRPFIGTTITKPLSNKI